MTATKKYANEILQKANTERYYYQRRGLKAQTGKK